MRLATLTPAQLDAWVVQARALTSCGRLPDYIPQLSQVDPQTLAIHVQTGLGQRFFSGDFVQPFALMSVVKPFLLLFALEHWGAEAVFQRVGMQPSDQSFHSVSQLTIDQGFPRNPMINSGAIALTAFLPGESGEARCEAFRQWLNASAQSQLSLDHKMLHSVRSLPNETNRTIARVLVKAKHLDHVERAIDTYNHLCCLSGTVADLAQLGLLLAQTNQIAPHHQRVVNALMLTCGLYEASGAFAARIGLPMKSGVSGALVGIVPREGAIACYGPAIDRIGNSVAGLFLVETLVQTLNVSVFN
jgi:glutaminase